MNVGIAIALLSAILLAIIWSVVAWRIDLEERETIAAASKQNSNLVIAYEEHTARTFKSIGQLAQLLIQEAARNQLKVNLAKYVDSGIIDSELSPIIGVYDEYGNSIANSAKFKPMNNADREYFQAHVREDTGRLYIGKPIQSRLTNKLMIPISRRINKADGSFGGVLLASVDPSYFTRFYRQADIGPNGVIELVGLDGISRARLAGGHASFGGDMRERSIMQEQMKAANGSFLSQGKRDGVARFISYRTLKDYALIVAVGISKDEVLSDFEQRRSRYYWVTALVSACILIFAAVLLTTLSRQRRMFTALAASEARLRATFSQAAVGVAQVGLDGRYLQVNRKLCDMLGYSEQELLARTSLDVTHPADAPASDDIRRTLLENLRSAASPEWEKRFLCKSGSVLWAAITTALVRDERGQPAYFVSMVQDISARRQAEERLRKVDRARHVMTECNRVLVHATNETSLVQDMCDTVVGSGGYHLAWVGYAEHDERKSVRPAAQSGFERDYLESLHLSWDNDGPGYGATGRAIHTSEPSVVNNVSTNANSAPWREAARRQGYGSLIALPLRLQNEAPLGALTIYATEIDAFDPAEIVLLQELAAELAYGIVNLRLRADHARAEEHLRESEELMRATFDHAEIGIVHTTADGRHLRVNQKFCDMLGYARDELLGMTVMDLTHPEDRGLDAGRRAGLIAGELATYSVQRRCVRKDGAVIWVNRTVSVVRDDAGEVQYFIRVIEDITERKHITQALHDSEARMRAMFEQAAVGFALTDLEGRYVEVNQKLCDILGYAREELIGKSYREISHPNDIPAAELSRKRQQGLIGSYSIEERFIRKDGSLVWVNSTVTPAKDADCASRNLIAVVEDITERKQLQDRLLHQAHYDNLTQLPNRVLFHDRLKQTLGLAQRRRWVTAVMFVDLDRFKTVNDTLGHPAGDRLLQLVAERLSTCVRTDDTVSRLGGDEFAVLLSDVAKAQDAALVAQKILDTLSEPFELDGNEAFVTASIGISIYPGDTTDAGALINNADVAMYRAKELGKNNYQFYTAALNERALDKLHIENDLRGALSRKEFVLHFQPKASLATGEITGFEALLRWQRRGGPLISPAEFIPLLEESGLIVPVGEWVLHAACAQIRSWQDIGMTPLPIAVNLSAKQFQRQDICAMVSRALHEYAIDPRLLELEITESAAMQNAEETIAALHRLKSLGLHISMDDFGTGYSSLSYLKRLPVDCLKIDRSFVTDLVTNPDDASIAQAVITMAHSLHLKVIAEGVETEAQLAFLAANGCDEMQGYYFSRPLPALECTALLKQGRKLPRPALAAAA